MATNPPREYDALQSAFHDAFRDDLYRLLDAFTLPPNSSVLDVPCGNGFYTRRLAERLGEGGRLCAIDASDAYLEQTREALAGGDTTCGVEVRRADAYHLPFADRTFDLVWCAQSLISLDPERATGEMYRVVKAEGLVAILEVDAFHHVLLPWPAELEAALPQAIHTASVERYGSGLKLSPSRRLRRVLKQTGFRSVRRETYPIERAAPFDAATTAFLDEHLAYLRPLVRPHLPVDLQSVFDRLTDPTAGDSLYQQSDSEIVCINAVYLAQPLPVSGRHKHSGGHSP
jgi:ubiquinone/menaquinone biosynthesis C-methylase UbiE